MLREMVKPCGAIANVRYRSPLVRMWDGKRHRKHHAWVTFMTREGKVRCLEAHRGAWNCQPATSIMHEPGATVKWWVAGKTWNDVLTLDRLRFCSGPWDAVIQELTSIPRGRRYGFFHTELSAGDQMDKLVWNSELTVDGMWFIVERAHGESAPHTQP